MNRRTTTLERVQAGIGANLRDARAAAGLTQEAAAARAGIDAKRWQKLEAGLVNATVRTLVRAAAALGTEFWALVQPRR